MRDEKGFDLWADDYDKAVGIIEDARSYPFAGYKEVLGYIFRVVTAKEKAKVLDLGFGTATLTAKLYERGCEVWGQDFSKRMLELAQSKMPSAHLYQGDFSQGLVPQIKSNTYDFIVATYSLHHLSDERKIEFIPELKSLLKPNGKILIGDVAFPNGNEMALCREQSGEDWDEKEFYWVYDEISKAFPQMEFKRFSKCAAVMTICK
ncbi:MAG: class I SAM-dependent methyltransferase [Clostridiales bacterium]|nr:class I SAM-dependent methyltransferase [Clostridiales bacterium]